MFLISIIARIFGLGSKGKSMSKKAQILQRNKKLHIILAAHRQHQQAQAKTQSQAVVKSAGRVSTPGAHAARISGGASEKEAMADVAIGKNSKSSQSSFTSKVRTVKGRKQRRKQRGRMRGFH